MHLIAERGENVAVLSVDPSSAISGGSILGDKTRMERLAVEERAFIRPSPSQGHLGGVTRRTRETILLCEAAGYRNILVETVGVGQSETAVRSMTDFFLLLMLAGAGDELQGMKRGIIEMLDGMAINKADGDNRQKAERARIEYAGALHLFPPSADGWTPRVLTCSAAAKEGIAEVWQMVLEHRELLEGNGFLAQLRNDQALQWMNELTMLGLEEMFRRNRAVAARLKLLREEVHRRAHDAVRGQPRAAGPLSPTAKTRRIARRDFMTFPILTAAEAASLIRQRTERWIQRIHAGRRAESDSDGHCRTRHRRAQCRAGVPDRRPDRRLDRPFAGWRPVQGEGDEVPHALPDQRRSARPHQRRQDALLRPAPFADAAGHALRLPRPGGCGRGGSRRSHRGRRHRAHLRSRLGAHLLQPRKKGHRRAESSSPGDHPGHARYLRAQGSALSQADSDLHAFGPHRLAHHHHRPGQDRGRGGDGPRGRSPRLQRDQPADGIDRLQRRRIPRRPARRGNDSEAVPADSVRRGRHRQFSARRARQPSRDSAVRDVHRGDSGFGGRPD